MLELEEGKSALILRFSCPQMRNPLSLALLRKLHDILDERPREEIIIFTGSDGVFASGANLKEISEMGAEEAYEFALFGQGLMKKIRERRTFAAINGICFGGGLDLALNCKKRVASPNAKFSHPGASIGIITGWGGTQILPRLIGKKRALELFLTAKQISAQEALEIGLIDAIDDSPLDFLIEHLS